MRLNNYHDIFYIMISFIKKSFYNKKNYKIGFSLLLLFIIIYYLINYIYNFKEGNSTINSEAPIEQSIDTPPSSSTNFYDPTIKDKIIDITSTISTKEEENKEKLAKIEGILENIEIDVNRMLDRDIDVGELISQGM